MSVLDLLNIDFNILTMFKDNWSSNRHGQVSFYTYDLEENIVSTELLGLAQCIPSSKGTAFILGSTALQCRNILFSDTYTNALIYLNINAKILELDKYAVIITGDSPNEEHIHYYTSLLPAVRCFYTLFPATTKGDIQDCQIDHFINKRNFKYELRGDQIIACVDGSRHSTQVSDFKYWKHIQAIRKRPSIKCLKPLKKKSSYYQLWKSTLELATDL